VELDVVVVLVDVVVVLDVDVVVPAGEFKANVKVIQRSLPIVPVLASS